MIRSTSPRASTNYPSKTTAAFAASWAAVAVADGCFDALGDRDVSAASSRC
ncbi:MAG: hypothetical protein MUE44_08140 [Oscillatoriaceae cyanobacterium Prado104]|nr:hypothetical protein [Oscillatoriaceae cyanobacterium Prado104]